MIDKNNLNYPWVTQFVENAKRCRHDGRLTGSMRTRIITGRALPSFLSCAFSWSGSPQGHEYWCNIERQG